MIGLDSAQGDLNALKVKDWKVKIHSREPWSLFYANHQDLGLQGLYIYTNPLLDFLSSYTIFF